MRRLNHTFDFESKYYYSFHDFWLDRQLDSMWRSLLFDFKNEWQDFSGFLSYEDEMIEQDIFLYDFYFSKIPIVQKKIDFSLSTNDVALETSYSDEYLAEKSSKVPDNFHFDEFFFDNYFLFLFLSFFFFPFILFELFFLFFFFFFTATYMLIDEDSDEDFFSFLEDEADISHYNCSEFHFVDFFSFDELFFYSGFWSNKPFLKSYNFFKFKK